MKRDGNFLKHCAYLVELVFQQLLIFLVLFQQIESLEMEISILQGIHHDHIVEYYGMQREPSCLSIFIEFIPMVMTGV